MAKNCAICEKPISALGVKYTTSDGYKVCWKCIREAGYGINASFLDIRKESLQDVKDHKEEALAQKQEVADAFQQFKTTRTLGNAIEIDENNKIFRPTGFSNLINIHSLSEISGYEIVENGTTMTSGGLGRAAIGAFAFGGAGAIVGAVTGKKKTISKVDSFRIKLNMSNLDNPIMYIDLIKKPIKSNSKDYKQIIETADKIISSLDIILKDNNPDSFELNEHQPSQSIPDEIRKYKELLDEGILTQEEFDTKKKELLGL